MTSSAFRSHMMMALIVLLSPNLLVNVGGQGDSTSLGSSNLQRCVTSEDALDATNTVDLFPDKFMARTYNGPGDFFPGKYLLDNSTDLLEITYHMTYKIVTNKFQNKSYLLYQCGTEPPLEEVESGKYHLILPVPHQGGIAITETPQIPPIELLGKRREMVAYIGDPQYVSSPCLNYMRDNETDSFKVYDLPYDANRSFELAMKQEFLAAHPDAIILEGPYGDKDDDRALSIAASQERTNVATFDWIGLYGALFNMEAEANRIAQETYERYQCSIANAAAVTADLPLEDQKKVLWANYIEGYNWSVAECTTWDETYYCELAAHCGVDIIERPEDMGYAPESLGGRYWYVNDDEILEIAKDADLWIYPSKYWDSMYESKKDLIDQFKAVQQKQVYDTQGQGPNGWYEQRLAEYDVLAQDFCTLVGTTGNANSMHKVKWFRNIFTDQIGSPGGCNAPEEIDQAFVPDKAECTAPASTTEAGADSGSSSVVGGTATKAIITVLCLLASALSYATVSSLV